MSFPPKLCRYINSLDFVRGFSRHEPISYRGCRHGRARHCLAGARILDKNASREVKKGRTVLTRFQRNAQYSIIEGGGTIIMPEQISKYPDVTLQVLRESGAVCGQGAAQNILKQCPRDRFCSLRTGEICVYGINEIPKMTQITSQELAKVV